jgi:hypothetical protein
VRDENQVQQKESTLHQDLQKEAKEGMQDDNEQRESSGS